MLTPVRLWDAPRIRLLSAIVETNLAYTTNYGDQRMEIYVFRPLLRSLVPICRPRNAWSA